MSPEERQAYADFYRDFLRVFVDELVRDLVRRTLYRMLCEHVREDDWNFFADCQRRGAP